MRKRAKYFSGRYHLETRLQRIKPWSIVAEEDSSEEKTANF
jgi:hypothetical protein